MLVKCVEDDTWNRRQAEYVADMQGALLKSFINAFGGNADFPLFSELIGGRRAEKQTAQEIKDHVIKRLLEG